MPVLPDVQEIVHDHQVSSDESSGRQQDARSADDAGLILTRPHYLRAGFAADVNDIAESGLLHVGEQWAPPQFMITDHDHPTWEFYLQLHGATRWRADGQIWTVRPGDLLGVAPRTIHAMAEHPRANIHFVYAALDPQRSFDRQSAVNDSVDLPRPVLHLRDAARLVDPFAQLTNEVTTTREFLRTGIALAVDRIVLELIRALRRSGPSRVLDLHPAVQETQTVLDRDYAHPWPLKDLAARVGLAPNYLAGLFSTELGRGTHEYQTERRIARTKQLLVTSDLSITGIAIEVGFSSGQHLARIFRQATGTTPSNYRKSKGPSPAP